MLVQGGHNQSLGLPVWCLYSLPSLCPARDSLQVVVFPAYGLLPMREWHPDRCSSLAQHHQRLMSKLPPVQEPLIQEH